MAKEADLVKAQAYGKRLALARKGKLSQAKLAEALGYQQPFLCKVERGDMMLRPYDYAVVARLLGVDLDTLIGELTPAEIAEIEDGIAARREERRRYST